MTSKREHVDGKKFCPWCEKLLPLDAFGKNSSLWDGLRRNCRSCLNARDTEKRRARGALPRAEREALPSPLRTRYVDDRKPCSRCGEMLPCGAFAKTKQTWDGVSPDCRACRAAAQKSWRETDAGFAQSERYRKSRYGVPLGWYAETVAAQGGGCGVCARKDRRLVVDHDHDTAAVRGLLCQQCNSALGMLGDDSRTAAAAVAYLEGHGR